MIIIGTVLIGEQVRAGGYAALTQFPENASVLTIEYKINLIAPAGDQLVAQGTVIKSGRTLTICRLEVCARQSDQRTLIAVGQQSLICLFDSTAISD